MMCRPAADQRRGEGPGWGRSSSPRSSRPSHWRSSCNRPCIDAVSRGPACAWTSPSGRGSTRRTALWTFGASSTKRSPARAMGWTSTNRSLTGSTSIGSGPSLASDIEIKRFELRWGNDYVMVANPRAMLYFRLEPWEADLLPLMDGTRTVGDITVARLEEEGDLDAAGVTATRADPGARWVPRASAGGLQRGRGRALDPLTPAQRKIRIFMKTLSIEWTGADRFVQWWYRYVLWPFFKPAGAAVAVLVAVGGFVVFVGVQLSGKYTLGSRSAPAESLILLGTRVRTDVLPRTRARRHDRPLRTPREGRRVHDLLRLAGVLRGGVRQPHARTPPADPAVVRRPVRRARPRGCVHPGVGAVPRRAVRGSALPVRADQLLRDLPEPDPAPGARRLLDPLRPDPGAGSAASAPWSSSSTTCGTSSGRASAFTKQEVGTGSLRA